MVLVELNAGWYDRETAEDSSWRWTQQAATLSFPNPRAPVTLHLDYDARAGLIGNPPRTLTITVADQVVRAFQVDARGRQQTNVPLTAGMLGQQDHIEVEIALDRPLVPADLREGTRDTRELGIQVYRVLVERSTRAG